MRKLIAAGIVAVATLVATNVNAQVGLYDDFSTGFIDPNLWQHPGAVCFTTSVRECVREIDTQIGALRFRLRHYGPTDSDVGNDFDQTELLFPDPNAVTEFRALVVVTDSEVTDCVANPGATTNQLIFSGAFFNTGSGEQFDDMEALFLLDKRSDTGQPGAVEAIALLNTQDVFFVSESLGSVSIGELVQIVLRWDPPNDRFVFGLLRSGMTPVFTALPYAASDSDPPAVPFRQLGVRTFPESCIDGSSVSDIDARVLRVLVNN